MTQSLANTTNASDVRARRGLAWLLAACVGVQSLTLAAQELDSQPAVRDSFSISSAYFANDYANNIDYAQFAMDVKSASGRLPLYGHEKY